MAMFKSLCFATALLALAGCTGVIVNDNPGPRASYFDGDFEYATHLGAIVTQVAGNPFDVPAETFQAAVLNQMQGHARVGSARFVAAPSEQTMAAYKVVAAFDMPAWVDGYVLCKGAASLPPPVKSPGEITLGMAFCFGDQLKSDVIGRVSGARSIDDPHFVDLVQRVTEAMIPAREDAGPDAP